MSGFNEVEVWLVIITATYLMYLWSSIRRTTCDSFTLRHNHFRNVTTKLLIRVTKDVKFEPLLHSLTDEAFEQRTANTSEDAHLDISSRVFWTKYQIAFFDL